MKKAKRNLNAGTKATKAYNHAGAYSNPRVRSGHASDYDAFKIGDVDETAYSRVASSSYLQSSAIKSAKRRRVQRKLLIILVSALAFALIAAGVALAYVSGISKKLSDGIDESLFSILVQTDTPEDPFYALLLGTDKSEARSNMADKYGDAFRSDSIMLARVDPQEKKASIVSIPRDTLVDLGEYGQGKVNAARAYGGPTLAVQTVSALAGVPITHYAEIDFDGFSKIVDTIGGIEVNVPIEINDSRAGGSLKAGKQTLNGKQALILCRSRHSYDDYGAGDIYRAANQRLVLSAIANKLLSSDIPTIAGSIESLAECVTTDMKVEEIISVAQSMRGIDTSKDIYTAVMPTNSQMIDGGWYEIVNEAEWDAMITRMDLGESPALKDDIDKATGTILASAGNGAANMEAVLVDTTATIWLRNGCGTDGICSDALAILEKMGYSANNVDVRNANNFKYSETLVIYKNPDKAKYAKGIAKKFKVGKAMQDNGEYLFDSDYLIVLGSDWKM